MTGNIHGSSPEFFFNKIIKDSDHQGNEQHQKMGSREASMENIQNRIPVAGKESIPKKKVLFKEKSFIAKAQCVLRVIVNVARGCWEIFKSKVLRCCGFYSQEANLSYDKMTSSSYTSYQERINEEAVFVLPQENLKRDLGVRDAVSQKSSSKGSSNDRKIQAEIHHPKIVSKGKEDLSHNRLVTATDLLKAKSQLHKEKSPKLQDDKSKDIIINAEVEDINNSKPQDSGLSIATPRKLKKELSMRQEARKKFLKEDHSQLNRDLSKESHLKVDESSWDIDSSDSESEEEVTVQDLQRQRLQKLLPTNQPLSSPRKIYKEQNADSSDPSNLEEDMSEESESSGNQDHVSPIYTEVYIEKNINSPKRSHLAEDLSGKNTSLGNQDHSSTIYTEVYTEKKVDSSNQSHSAEDVSEENKILNLTDPSLLKRQGAVRNFNKSSSVSSDWIKRRQNVQPSTTASLTLPQNPPKKDRLLNQNSFSTPSSPLLYEVPETDLSSESTKSTEKPVDIGREQFVDTSTEQPKKTKMNTIKKNLIRSNMAIKAKSKKIKKGLKVRFQTFKNKASFSKNS